MTAAQTLIWQTAGKPPIIGAKGKLLKPHPAHCCITGEHTPITADAKRALGENFTDLSLWANQSGRVGQAALWCCSGKGKESPRMWTWICAPGRQLPDSAEKAPIHTKGICQTNRGNTRPVIDTLMHPPQGEWVLCIATSGQKHVLPYAKTNHGTDQWTIRMEDTTITATPAQWAAVFHTTLALRRLRIPADSIKKGTPDYVKTPQQLQRWRELTDTLNPYRTAPITDLALWCITKPIMEDTHAYPNH